MTTSVLLIRDDTFDELVLDGCLHIDRQRPGSMTRKRVPDRTHVVDGVSILPHAISIEARIPQSPSVPNLTTGPERIAEVLEWLEEARRVGTTVSLQEPGRAQDTDLVVEEFSDRSDRWDAPQLSLRLGQARFAETRQVQTRSRTSAASTAGTAPVPSETAKDGEAESDGGRRSLLSVGLDSLTSLIGGGG